jgi:brefeldin A-inhibited guanine nucleotide-exchange protein
VHKNYNAEFKVLKETTKDQKALEKLQDFTTQQVDAVPLYTVPRWLKSLKAKPKPEIQDEEDERRAQAVVAEQDAAVLHLLNEVGAPSGKFGWCVACRGTANLYCKHTRHPVCSYECKQRHIRLLEEAHATNEQPATPSTRAPNSAPALDEPYQRDALLVFNKLC